MTNHLSWRYIILLQTRKEIRIFNILLNIFRYWLSLIKINSSRIKHCVLTFIIEADDGGEIQLTCIIEADDGGEIQLMLTRQLRNNLFFSIFLIDAGGADLKANLFVAILPSSYYVSVLQWCGSPCWLLGMNGHISMWKGLCSDGLISFEKHSLAAARWPNMFDLVANAMVQKNSS